MIIEEGKVITLENNNQYFILTDIGELDDLPGYKYYFAIGVTPEETVDIDDLVFFQTEYIDGNYIVEEVDEDSESYKRLSLLQTVISASEMIPGYEEKLNKMLENIE